MSARRVTATTAGSRLLLVVAMTATGLAQAVAQTSDPPAPFSATIAVDRTSIRLGERLDVRVTLDGPDVASARPALGQRLGDFDVVSIEPRGFARLLGRAPRQWRVVLTSFEAGDRQLSNLAVEGTAPDGRAFVSSPAPALTVAVSSPQVRAEDPLRPPDPALPAPGPSVALSWLAGMLVASGALLVAWTIGRPHAERLGARLKRTRQWRRLHRTLEAVARRPGQDPVTARAQCDTVAGVLREGSQLAVARRLLDLSTTELVATLAATSPGRAFAPQLGPVLSDLDRLRFTGQALGVAEVSASVDRARQVLRVAEAAARAEERRAS